MTLASHARGPEFEPRCEYFHFFFRRKKNIEQQNQKSRGKYSFLPLHHAFSVTLFVIDSRGFDHDTSLYYVFTTHRLSEWKFRIQVFSKLVESTYSSLGSKHTYSVPQTLLRFLNILCEQKKIQNNNKNLSENVVGK